MIAFYPEFTFYLDKYLEGRCPSEENGSPRNMGMRDHHFNIQPRERERLVKVIKEKTLRENLF